MKEENKVSKSAIVEATFKKLPWLREYFNPQQIDKVSFRSFTYDLLGQDCGWSWSLDRGGCLTKKILFFSKEGKPIGQVGKKITPMPAQMNVPKGFLFWSSTQNIPASIKTEIFSESVSRALKRLDQKHEVFYIVGLLERDLIITKPSSSSENSIMESVEAEMKRAEQEVEAAIR